MTRVPLLSNPPANGSTDGMFLGQAAQSDGRLGTKGGDEELPTKHDATATRTSDGGSVGETPQPA